MRKRSKGSASLCLSTAILALVAQSPYKSLLMVRWPWPQLFSNSERRSSLLLLGRSGGSKYESSSSGFANSGRRSKDGSGMSDPDASKPFPGVNDRSPWGWLPGVCGCCCGGC